MADGSRRRRYRCSTRGCSRPIVSASAPALEKWAVETLWLMLGSRVAGDEPEAADLGPLEDAVELAQRRLDQVMASEARDALGDLWATDVKARRLEHEAALTALGEARQEAQARAAAPDVVDLRELWDGMSPPERHEALRSYGLRYVEVSGPNPSQWILGMP